MITKIDNLAIEGSFTFIASSSRTNKTIAVTDGGFPCSIDTKVVNKRYSLGSNNRFCITFAGRVETGKTAEI